MEIKKIKILNLIFYTNANKNVLRSAVEYLSKDILEYFTEQVFRVDGGWREW